MSLRGLVAGGVRNPVLVNLLMVCILAGGLIAARRMPNEAFPEFRIDYLSVEVIYPGASPGDVEKSICAPVEEAIRGIDGIREIVSLANEGAATVWISLKYDVDDPREVLDEVKEKVEQITTFPPEAEKPIIKEVVLRSEVISVAIYGPVGERVLKRYAQEVRDDLLVEPNISQVALAGVREDEILVEISQDALTAYNLSLEQLIGVVSRSSLDMPAGVIRTAEESVTLRVTGQRYTAADYEKLVVIENKDAIVRLGEIADVREGFEESIRSGRFDGAPAVLVAVYKTPSEDSTSIAQTVRDYVTARQPWLPESLKMSVWGDTSAEINAMLDMLLDNALMGIALVFIVLLLFVELRHAFWVAIGIPISFGGALIVMYYNGETVNLISIFALIMVSGIIVDDAIVLAENIHARRRAGDPPEEASIAGTVQMAAPVLGSSATTIVAFIPLLFVVGVMGKFIHVLPIVVIAAIVFSAVEAFLILPTHLCHRAAAGEAFVEKPPTRFRRYMDGLIETTITRWFRPLSRWTLRYRAVTFAVAVAVFAVVCGVVLSGRTPIVLLPKEDANVLTARVRLAEGAPIHETDRVAERMRLAGEALNADPEVAPKHGGALVKHVYTVVGEYAGWVGFISAKGSNLCEARLELMPAEDRLVDAGQVIERWRKLIGPIPEALEFTIERQKLGPTDHPIEVRLLGGTMDDLGEAAERVKAKLEEFAGVVNTRDDLVPGKREIRVRLKPVARSLGLTLSDVAQHLRHGFFGGEAVTLQRGRDQVKVRIRYPEEERKSIADLENVRIPTPRGDRVPFREVADVTWVRSYANIWHQDGFPRVRVIGDLDEERANAEQILEYLDSGFLADVVNDYNNMTYVFGGDRQRLQESLDSLKGGYVLAVLVMYAILASMLRSYVQPLVIILALPFGVVGVIVGHLLMGYNLTLMSLFGLVALSGVVVNDSLVLVDAINKQIREGKSVWEAVAGAGELRFRAVILTSITTIAGLMPLLLERSSTARSVIPMAISLSFGILFATALTLIVVPATFLIVNDGRRFVRWLMRGGAFPARETVEDAAHDDLMTVR